MITYCRPQRSCAQRIPEAPSVQQGQQRVEDRGVGLSSHRRLICDITEKLSSRVCLLQLELALILLRCVVFFFFFCCVLLTLFFVLPFLFLVVLSCSSVTLLTHVRTLLSLLNESYCLLGTEAIQILGPALCSPHILRPYAPGPSNLNPKPWRTNSKPQPPKSQTAMGASGHGTLESIQLCCTDLPKKGPRSRDTPSAGPFDSSCIESGKILFQTPAAYMRPPKRY